MRYKEQDRIAQKQAVVSMYILDSNIESDGWKYIHWLPTHIERTRANSEGGYVDEERDVEARNRSKGGYISTPSY